ncbi:MAG: hypothetical protein LBS12_00300 [Prevotellaceae bacterium]|jgi:uncharacterized iron-regulated protein|nr:hypothetical protein [Prevotellaceae bacterium]
MKRNIKNWLFGITAGMLSIAFAGCEKDSGDESVDNDATYKAILQEYVNATTIPTYRALAEAALNMRAANEALKSGQSAVTIRAAADAWVQARIYWEQSEAFLFGPVSEDAFDIDGHIDSWPLEKSAIDAVLANEASGLTSESCWRKDAEEIGFHVTEYLLFRDGQPRASLSNAELKYLTAATDALIWDCVLAYVAWAGEANVSQNIRTVFRENQDIVDFYEENTAYHNFGDKLKNATGNYSSVAEAFGEIASGCADIADEVGATKIESPFATHKVEEVESWYSWHSLADYEGNIVSIRNAYFGGRDTGAPKTNSLSAFVAGKNSDLDNRIKAKIEDAIAKIRAIGNYNAATGTYQYSFYEVVRDQIRGEQVEAAVEACTDLSTLFKQIDNLID